MEQITTHMCDGPPISILNLGFLPLMRQLRVVRNRAGSTSLIKESLVCVAVGGSWQEITEKRLDPTYFQTHVGTECSKPACGGCGLMTCSYIVTTHLSRPAVDEAAMSHRVTEP